MPQRPAQPIQLPDDKVSPGRSWSRSCSRVGRSLRGAAGGLDEHPIAAGRVQGVDLEVWLLVVVETRA
jgi:hypothetical protein